MNRRLTLFDRMPSVFPTALETSFLSGNFFNEFDKIFNGQKLRQMSVYPTDIYTLFEGDDAIASVIEIACAGLGKERCSVKLEENKLFVDLGLITNVVEETLPEKQIEDSPKKSKKDKNIVNPEQVIESNVERTKQYMQRQNAERAAHMSWTLSNKIDKKKIKVEYIDGILKITCPFRKKDVEETKIFDIN